MSIPGSNESFPEPCLERLLAFTLDQVRDALRPDLTETLLPEGTALLGVRTELYQSQTLATGRDVMPDSYPASDRSLVILTLQEDKQVFLVGGKIDPTDRFDMSNALGGGVDPRPLNRLAYTYDGAQTIVEHMPDGNVNRYIGDYGDPEILLSHIRQSLGMCIATESVGVDPSA